MAIHKWGLKESQNQLREPLLLILMWATLHLKKKFKKYHEPIHITTKYKEIYFAEGGAHALLKMGQNNCQKFGWKQLHNCKYSITGGSYRPCRGIPDRRMEKAKQGMLD